MKEYAVKITETLEKIVTVQASSRFEAEEKVKEAWNNSEYVLNSENFVGAAFDTQSERALEQNKIDVLLVEPGQYPKPFRVGNELDDLRAVVDGDIECVYPFDEEVGIILNEEGKILGLPLNRAIRDEDGNMYDIFAGTFMVVGLTEDDFGSLSPELMEKFEVKFHQPEMFVCMGKGIMAVPIPDESIRPKEMTKGLEPKVKCSTEHSEI